MQKLTKKTEEFCFGVPLGFLSIASIATFTLVANDDSFILQDYLLSDLQLRSSGLFPNQNNSGKVRVFDIQDFSIEKSFLLINPIFLPVIKANFLIPFIFYTVNW